MDLLVAPEITGHVLADVVAVHLVVGRLDGADLVVGDVLAGQTPRQSLQPAHHVEQLADALDTHLADARATVGQQVDNALGGQDLDRLAQGGARNAEHLAQLALGNPRPVRKVAVGDVVAQPGQDLGVQRCGNALAIAQGQHPRLDQRQANPGRNAFTLGRAPTIPSRRDCVEPFVGGRRLAPKMNSFMSSSTTRTCPV